MNESTGETTIIKERDNIAIGLNVWKITDGLQAIADMRLSIRNKEVIQRGICRVALDIGRAARETVETGHFRDFAVPLVETNDVPPDYRNDVIRIVLEILLEDQDRARAAIRRPLVETEFVPTRIPELSVLIEPTPIDPEYEGIQFDRKFSLVGKNYLPIQEQTQAALTG